MPEGVAYSILLMNAITPLIDRYVRPKPYGYIPPEKPEVKPAETVPEPVPKPKDEVEEEAAEKKETEGKGEEEAPAEENGTIEKIQSEVSGGEGKKALETAEEPGTTPPGTKGETDGDPPPDPVSPNAVGAEDTHEPARTEERGSPS